MSKKDKITEEEKDLMEEMEEEIEELEDSDGDIDEEKLEESLHPKTDNSKEILAKVTADFENFKRRTERDRDDMVFFLKSDILKKILPRLDDIDRILKNTPKDMRENPLYEGVLSMQKKLISDLDKMGVKPFDSIGCEVDPDKHDVMTTVSSEDKKDEIIEEFEKGYTLDGKILRHAKVVVGS